MALYQPLGACSPPGTFGACASCADLTSGPEESSPVPGSNVSVNVTTPGAQEACPRPRWLLWLLIGVGLGYLAND